MPEPDPIIVASGDRGLKAAIGICAAIIIVTALYFTRVVFAPLAFALLALAIVWPVQRRLQRWLPKIVALAISLLVTVFVVTEFISLFTWSFGRVGRYVISDAVHFQLLYGQMAEWLAGHGIVIAGIWAEHFNVGWMVRFFRSVTVWMNGMLSFTIVMLTYVILGALEVDDAIERCRAIRGGQFAQTLVPAFGQIAAKLRRYMLVRTLTSVATGLLVWGFASLCGLHFAAEWGLIAFALNYIPFLGPLVATVLPTLIAIAQFGSWQVAITVFAGLNAIQFLVGSYIEPRIAGRALSMSPFLVLFAVFFWTFIWGIAGAFIGVPLMIAILTICEQYPSSRWVAELLGGSMAKPAAR